MFNWLSFRKEKELDPINFSVLETDMHSHLIPAIDDGSPDLETSINLIKELKDLGYRKIITTPHVMSDFYQNDSSIILKGLKSLSDEIKIQSIDIEIAAAAEYYVDFDFEAKISKEEFLTFGDNYILIELSFAEPPPNLYDIIFKLQALAVIMVLKFIGTPTSIVLAIILWTLSLSLYFFTIGEIISFIFNSLLSTVDFKIMCSLNSPSCLYLT